MNEPPNPLRPSQYRPSQYRPSQWAALLLASGESLPRQRARDQQADRVGSQLKQRLLQRLFERDPEPADIVSTLNELIAEFGEPTGPSRAMARVIADEWNSTSEDQKLTAWLLDQAIHGRENNRP